MTGEERERLIKAGPKFERLVKAHDELVAASADIQPDLDVLRAEIADLEKKLVRDRARIRAMELLIEDGYAVTKLHEDT